MEFHQLAEMSCKRLNSMASELLEYRKASEIKLASIDIASIVKAVANSFILRSHQTTLTVEYMGPESLYSFADGSKLERVLHNIVQNAVQAMEGSDTQKVSIALTEKDSKILLDISDTGPGIPEAHREKIFLPTFSTKGVHGNGLGLAYCQQVIEGHQGTIEVFNHRCGGAHFHIELPYRSLN
jgi:C4-dicarboxylate-specific signal transduction histidine kinase